jgi:hypothetical protein
MGTAEPSGIPVAFGGAEESVAESGELLAEPGVTVPESGGTVERLSGTGIFGEELKAQRKKR